MKFSINVPILGEFADARKIAGLAKEAEEAGWDGVFIWDHILWDNTRTPIGDPWTSLAAIAMSTSRVRIGTMLTPLARRRPWMVARQAAALDHLSGGRMTLAIGLGGRVDYDFAALGEVVDNRQRAERLDEGLEILNGLWSGEPFHFEGKHHHISEVIFQPRPLQQPRIPIWIGGKWPHQAPMRRAARWDGACPEKVEGHLTPQDWRDILSFIGEQRSSTSPFDAVHPGLLPADPVLAVETAHAYQEAGVTWWTEVVDSHGHPYSDTLTWVNDYADVFRKKIRQGPPRL